MSSESQGSMRECQVHLTGPDDTHYQPDEEYTVGMHKMSQSKYICTAWIELLQARDLQVALIF